MPAVSIDVLTNALHEVTGLDSVDPTIPVGQLGLDSLALVEWLYAIEDDLGLEVDQATMEQLPGMSVSDICEALRAV